MKAWARRHGWLIALLPMLVVLVGYGVHQGQKWADCREDGGKFVAGVGTYECVDRP